MRMTREKGPTLEASGGPGNRPCNMPNPEGEVQGTRAARELIKRGFPQTHPVGVNVEVKNEDLRRNTWEPQSDNHAKERQMKLSKPHTATTARN